MIDRFWFGAAPLAALLIAAGAGCAEKQSRTALLDYTQSAEDLYAEAMEEFDAEDCVDAEKLFQQVRRDFPYSSYAPLAELHIADCAFIQDNHAEAAVAYKQFIKAFPTHEQAHYAAFKRSESYYEMIPGDWIITPPPHERDQAATRDARSALRHFLRTYPRSEYMERAEELLAEVENALVRHEMYVAEFYLKRDEKNAAAVRLEVVREKFPDAGLVPDAMFLQGRTYLEMNRIEEARRVFEDIMEFYPEHHQALRARDYLEHLEDKHPSQSRGKDG
ncbi:MAG: outer membrane protein assembly factor BamD [Polyangia bacterium]